RRAPADVPALRAVAAVLAPARRLQQLRLQRSAGPSIQVLRGRGRGPQMTGPITVGGHLRIRPFNTAESYPEQRLDNDLCQAVVAGNTVYLRGQVPQDLDTGESVHAGNPAAQAEQVMTNVETLLAEAGVSVEHVVSCTVYLTDIRHREPVYRVLGRHLK